MSNETETTEALRAEVADLREFLSAAKEELDDTHAELTRYVQKEYEQRQRVDRIADQLTERTQQWKQAEEHVSELKNVVRGYHSATFKRGFDSVSLRRMHEAASRVVDLDVSTDAAPVGFSFKLMSASLAVNVAASALCEWALRPETCGIQGKLRGMIQELSDALANLERARGSRE